MTTGTILTLQMTLDGLMDRYSRDQAIADGSRMHRAIENSYDEAWTSSMGIDRQVSIFNEFALNFQKAELMADPEISVKLRGALDDYEVQSVELPIIFGEIEPENSAAAFRPCSL